MLYVVYIVYTNLPCELFERVDIPEEVATVRENTNNRETNFLKNELISKFSFPKDNTNQCRMQK